MEKTEIRIVAGSLRGRRLTVVVHPGLRPTPQRVRESFFSILGNAIPDRPFFDLFAGTGVVGLEALSRGASAATFIERDNRLGNDIESHLRKFGLTREGQLLRTDVYRWAERWRPPGEPVNVFVSPPFPDLEQRPDDFHRLIEGLQTKLLAGSILTVQGEDTFDPCMLPSAEQWEARKYGRNVLLFWEPADSATQDASG